MPLPYLGSKEAIAHKIYKTIAERESTREIVDMFAGGGAITEYFATKQWSVKSNDADPDIAALLDKVYIKGVRDAELCSFVTKQEFDQNRRRPAGGGFKSALTRVVFSFGNSGSSYLYAGSKQASKHAWHDLVVNRDAARAHEAFPGLVKYIDRIALIPNRQGRLRAMSTLAKANGLDGRLEHIERINRILKASALRRKKLDIEVVSMDYADVEVKPGQVVYCDPPYDGTAEYQFGAFDSARFWRWARDQSRHSPVYISEYSAPEDFKAILEIPKRKTLGNNDSMSVEKLYVHESRLT